MLVEPRDPFRVMYLRDLIQIGTKIAAPDIIDVGPIVYNLGAGKQELPWVHTKLDLPGWDGERDAIPAFAGTVDTLFAVHFLEHLSVAGVVRVLREAERVLQPGGTFNIVVPHAISKLAYEDLDHRARFCEDTWRNLFRSTYYDKHSQDPWRFRVGANFIFGHKIDNLCLFTQLVRE